MTPANGVSSKTCAIALTTRTQVKKKTVRHKARAELEILNHDGTVPCMPTWSKPNITRGCSRYTGYDKPPSQLRTLLSLVWRKSPGSSAAKLSAATQNRQESQSAYEPSVNAEIRRTIRPMPNDQLLRNSCVSATTLAKCPMRKKINVAGKKV